ISPEIPVEVDFMSVSSYGDSTTTSGTIHIEKDLGIPIQGKHVIIVEDIVDSGLTLLHVYNILSGRGARSLPTPARLENPSCSNSRATLSPTILSIISDLKSQGSSSSVSVSTTLSGIAISGIYVY